MFRCEPEMLTRDAYPYVEENLSRDQIGTNSLDGYSRELKRMYNSTFEDVQRMRQKAGLIVMRDPVLTQITHSMPAPNLVKSRPAFSAQLKARVAASYAFKQPFSGADSVATINQTGLALLWDAQSVKRYEWFNVTRGGIMCIAVNPSGSMLLTGGLSCHIEAFSLGHELNERLYEKQTQRANFPLYNSKPGESSDTGRPANYRCVMGGHHDSVSAVLFANDSYCISLGQDGQALGHDIVTGLCSAQVDYSSPVNTADNVTNSESEYCIGLRDGRIVMGDLRLDRPGVEIANGLPSPEKVRVLDDGYSMIAAYRGQIELFDLRSFGSYDSFTCDLGLISAVDVSPSGRMLICGTDIGHVTTLDMVRHQWASKPFAKKNDRISGIHLCGDKIFVGSWDGSFSAYKIKS